MQVETETAPMAEEYLPAKHEEHAVMTLAPMMLEYFPATHEAQTLAPVET